MHEWLIHILGVARGHTVLFHSRVTGSRRELGCADALFDPRPRIVSRLENKEIHVAYAPKPIKTPITHKMIPT
jgi:hypothetical protein